MNPFRLIRKQNLRFKFILAFLVVALVPLIVTSLYGNWTTSRVLEREAIDSALADLQLRAGQIEGYLRGARENLLFLSQLESLQTLVSGVDVDEPQRQRVESEFLEFAKTHPGIFQARYIDERGMEVVRVEAGSEGVTAVSPENMQNKVDRYYYYTTMQLPSGSVYVSPVDLNREFGEIQEPYVPTIRYATPVFHRDGARAGIVILNLYAEPFLQLARQAESAGSTLALVDGAGYYLVHPEAERQWGSPADLHTNQSALMDYPKAWSEMLTRDSGVFAPWREQFWPIIRGLFQISRNSEEDEYRVLVYQAVNPGNESGPRWLLMHDAPHVTLFASVAEFRVTAVLILIFTVILAVGMAVSMASNLTAPILRLTEAVREYGYGRTQQSVSKNLPAAGDEILELTMAFNQMSTALDQHLEQLSLLNRAGRHIAARLEWDEVLAAVITAVERLFPVDYTVVSLDGADRYSSGDRQWAAHQHSAIVQPVREAALTEGNWRITGLLADDVPVGYLCCAPICVDGILGLIELYGSDPVLGESGTGDLLATLSVHISIALDNAELYEQLADRSQELQVLLEQLINAQEEERRMVAYDIHDGLIQMLVGSRLQLNNFHADQETHPQRAEVAFHKGEQTLAAAIIEARRIIEGLRPATLDDLGLVTTVRHMAEETSQACGCELEFIADVGNGRLPSPLETTAFRITQEAINNTRKYAPTTPKLRVRLQRVNGDLNIEVRDWGQGFDQEELAANKGIGLKSMCERANLVGGQCSIESQLGAGTVIRVSLPVTRYDR